MSDVPETKDPERLLETAGPTLRALLRAGREEAPDDTQLALLAAKLGPIVGGGGGGGGAAGGAATKAAIAKGVAGAMIAKVVGAVATVVIVGVSAARLVSAPSSTLTAIPAPSVLSTAIATTVVPTPPATSAAIELVAPSTTPPAPLLAPPSPPPDETKLVGRAQSDLLTNPARALSECNDLAKLFPHGELVQEREVVAIDALVRLGRRDEANARASRFETAYPQSAYRRRIDAILEK